MPYVAPDEDAESKKLPIMYVFRNRNNEDLALGVIDDFEERVFSKKNGYFQNRSFFFI